MPQPTTHLLLPQPCAESWAAMTPTGGGRHCAACQKTVVDFTHKTDAEILTILANALGGETCGRFGADQLNRPLVPAAGPAARNRWQAWVAVGLAAWGLRAGTAEAAGPRTLPSPSTLHPARKAGPARPAGKSLRGVVRDAGTRQPIAGAAVFLKGENRMTMTDAEGHFSLPLPGKRVRSHHTLAIHRTGYRSKLIRIPVAQAPSLVRVTLQDDVSEATVVALYKREQRQMLSGAVSAVTAAELPTPAPPPASGQPASGRAGTFFRWLLTPFRHKQKPVE